MSGREREEEEGGVKRSSGEKREVKQRDEREKDVGQTSKKEEQIQFKQMSRERKMGRR